MIKQMNRRVAPLIVMLAGVILAGCVSTSETQISSSVWQIQARGQGAMARGKTANELFRRAAELTVEQGYSHFVLGVPQTSSSHTMGGITPVQANIIGNSVFVSGGQPIVVYRENTTALVAMANSAADGALDARDVLMRVQSN